MKNYTLFFLFFSCYMPFCFAQTKRDCLSRQYIIAGAQLADDAYSYSKDAYFRNNAIVSYQLADSVLYIIDKSVNSMDSAILLAPDTEKMAIYYAKRAKRYILTAQQMLIQFKQGGSKNLSKQAAFYAANAVIDAYHASFYFKNCKKQPETAPQDIAEKEVPARQLTKLDIDQTLFALLDEHLHQKAEEDKKEITKLTQNLKKEKDPSKSEKIKEEIKRIETEEAQLEQKDKHTKVKLDSINARIEKRDKAPGSGIKPEETVFSKSMKRPADEWDKQVVLDAELPMGLIYQVQIGYYKSLVINEIFRGLTPIMGKTMPDGGVSYSIGLFEKNEDAQQAKNYVKSIGLNDAFVIAHYNGKKISMAEAIKLEKK